MHISINKMPDEQQDGEICQPCKALLGRSMLLHERIAHHIIKPARDKGMAMAKSDANASAHLM